MKRLFFEDDAIIKIIREYTYEAGVAQFSNVRSVKYCVRSPRRNPRPENTKLMITEDQIEKLLGPQQFFFFEARG